jgi:glycine dehydrogenase
MAGMEVVVVGEIGRERRYRPRRFPRQGGGGGRPAGRGMITYPSTHGVFEETVREVCASPMSMAGRSISTGRTSTRWSGWRGPGTGRGCQPPEPAQDLLHPPWRRRPGHGADRREGASGAASAGPSRDGRARTGPVSGAPFGSASILPISYAYVPPDGRRGPDAGHQGRDPERQLHRGAAEGAYDVLFTGAERAGRA